MKEKEWRRPPPALKRAALAAAVQHQYHKSNKKRYNIFSPGQWSPTETEVDKGRQAADIAALFLLDIWWIPSAAPDSFCWTSWALQRAAAQASTCSLQTSASSQEASASSCHGALTSSRSWRVNGASTDCRYCVQTGSRVTGSWHLEKRVDTPMHCIDAASIPCRWILPPAGL